ncbi:hypothetical protein LJC10_05950 [Selenomonadales bacterium OttesenSCG-928-I06]|nr:hypothetical protein [Selenomonadales bacterium OttesenSCG-928-I06]
MKLDNSEIRPIINTLSEIMKTNEFDVAKLNDCIDSLETIKAIVSDEDESVIDNIDEAQDYLYYLISSDDTTVSDEVKDEITEVIENLKNL